MLNANADYRYGDDFSIALYVLMGKSNAGKATSTTYYRLS
jgi:hypothetical protein